MKIFDSFRQPATYKVVEVQAPRAVQPMDRDVAASVGTLQGHPGFQWLLSRLRLQNAQLKAALIKNRHASLADAEFLQSGIAWTGWLEEQFLKAINFHTPTPSEALPDEEAAFTEIQKFVELLK